MRSKRYAKATNWRDGYWKFDGRGDYSLVMHRRKRRYRGNKGRTLMMDIVDHPAMRRGGKRGFAFRQISSRPSVFDNPSRYPREFNTRIGTQHSSRRMDRAKATRGYYGTLSPSAAARFGYYLRDHYKRFDAYYNRKIALQRRGYR